MPKKKYIQFNYDKMTPLIKAVCRNSAAFSEKLGGNIRLYSDWKRGQKRPSPEDAARACVVLKCSPSEIMLIPEEIDLVTSLIENEKPTDKSVDGQDAYLMGLAQRLSMLSPDQQDLIVRMIQQFEATSPAE